MHEAELEKKFILLPFMREGNAENAVHPPQLSWTLAKQKEKDWELKKELTQWH